MLERMIHGNSVLCCFLLLASTGCRCSEPTFGPDEAARICLTLQTCSAREFSSTYGNTLEACTTTPSPILPWPGTLERTPVFTSGLEEPFGDLYRCLLEAQGDCRRAAACWALDGDAGTCRGNYGILNGSCRNQTLSGCTLDSQRFEVNCARYSETCTDLNFFGSFNVCAAAKCPAVPTCRGDVAEFCSGSTLLLWDCSRTGRKCEAPLDGGNAGCVLGEKTCDPPSGRRCEGTVAISCEGLGLEARTDCALNPTRRRCEAGECVDTGKECAALPASCEGSAVKFCQDGFLKKLDCASAGFGECDAGRCLQKSGL
jgi:hypothetical protein